MVTPSPRPFVLVAALMAASCSCPNLPLDPLPQVGDSSETNPFDSSSTNPWHSDEPPDDTEAQGPAEGSNMLMNGGFEQGEGEYSGVGYGWETNDGASHGENWFDGHTPYSGSSAQCISASWSAAAIRQISRDATVTPGSYYRLRAMVRQQDAVSGHGWYLLGLRWYSGESYVSEVQMVNPHVLNYDWTQIVIEAQAPDGVDRGAAYLAAYTDGTSCYDDVVFAELTY